VPDRAESNVRVRRIYGHTRLAGEVSPEKSRSRRDGPVHSKYSLLKLGPMMNEGRTRRALYAGGLSSPDELVHLYLEADGETVFQDPASEGLEVDVSPDR